MLSIYERSGETVSNAQVEYGRHFLCGGCVHTSRGAAGSAPCLNTPETRGRNPAAHLPTAIGPIASLSHPQRDDHLTKQEPGLETTFLVATVDDVAVALTLIRAYYEHDGIAFEREAIERGLRQLIREPSIGGIWLIRRGEQLCGYFVLTYGFDLEFGGMQATMTDLYLVPRHRRSGVGRATIAFVERLLRDRGIGALELQAERHNRSAVAFYKRLGFVEHDRIPFSKSIASV